MQINSAYIHLIVNHLPVLLPLIGAAVVLAGVYGKLHQTQIVGVVLIALGALFAIPTYLTGSAAQSVAKNYPLVTQVSIDRHAQAALYALIAIEIVGVVALALLWQAFRRKDAIPRSQLIALVALTLFTSILIAQTAHLGGLIRHEEIERGSF